MSVNITILQEEKEKIVEKSVTALRNLMDDYDAYAKKLKERIEGGHEEIEDKEHEDEEDKKSQSPENNRRDKGKRRDNSDSDDDHNE